MTATILIPIEAGKTTGTAKDIRASDARSKTPRPSLLEPALRIAKSA
jgi:hypothetical protein